MQSTDFWQLIRYWLFAFTFLEASAWIWHNDTSNFCSVLPIFGTKKTKLVFFCSHHYIGFPVYRHSDNPREINAVVFVVVLLLLLLLLLLLIFLFAEGRCSILAPGGRCLNNNKTMPKVGKQSENKTNLCF